MLEVMPASENHQIQELKRMLGLESAALVAPGSNGDRIELPPSVHKLLKELVEHMSRGKSVVISPKNQELTTQAAADFLGVSRPHVVKLLESGEIPFSRTGSHRRILLEDLTTYARHRDNQRAKILNELALKEMADGSYE